jgi:quinol monooxygenase YgiN
MIMVTAKCRILPDSRAGFIEDVRRIIPLVRKETGCIRYEFVVDVFHPDTFLFLEEWESQEHLDRHLTCHHMREYFAKTASCHSAPTELTIYETTSSQSVTL